VVLRFKTGGHCALETVDLSLLGSGSLLSRLSLRLLIRLTLSSRATQHTNGCANGRPFAGVPGDRADRRAARRAGHGASGLGLCLNGRDLRVGRMRRYPLPPAAP
jgi:hypothetical protein